MNSVVWRNPGVMMRGKLTGSNHKTAAAWNRVLALRLLRQHGTLSRRQIAQMTGLRGSTLSYIVRELTEKDVLRTVGKLPSKTVGQKQILLRINPDLGYTLGLSLRPGAVQVLWLNTAGERIAGTTFEIDAPLEQMPGRIREALVDWMEEQGRPVGRLLGLGAGVPGAIDAASGTVIRSTPLNADNVPLGKLLAEEFECPVLIDHDARVAALAEAAEGAAKNVSHFLFFLINPRWEAPNLHLRAFGSALFLEGKLYRGAHSSAGEIDETLVPRRNLIGSAEDFEAWMTPDAPVTPVLEDLAHDVARTVATLVNFIDVQRVVLGGSYGMANTALLELIRRQTLGRLILGHDRQVKIVPSLVGGEAIARGAAIGVFSAAVDNGWLLERDPDDLPAVRPLVMGSTL